MQYFLKNHLIHILKEDYKKSFNGLDVPKVFHIIQEIIQSGKL